MGVVTKSVENPVVFYSNFKLILYALVRLSQKPFLRLLHLFADARNFWLYFEYI